VKKKFGIIGCEHAHIRIFIEEMLALGHECAGIYDPGHSKLAASLADQLGLPLLADKQQLLAPDVDLIGSSAINNEKIDIIEECERYGKSIMVDKPAVTNRLGYERLLAVINRGKIQVGMLLTERFHPAICTLKDQVDQGLLGTLTSIGMRKPHRLNSPGRPSWFFSKEQSGGILVDLLIHDFDLLHWLTGQRIVKSTGFMGKHILPEYPDFYDVVSLQVLLQNQIVAQLYADWHTPDKSWTWGDGRIFVTGTKGFAELRLCGDPLVNQEAMLLLTTHLEGTVQVKLEQPSNTITEDFLLRIAGMASVITHEDILLASQAAINADEQVEFVQTL
jgi:predicted dehydrogenase